MHKWAQENLGSEVGISLCGGVCLTANLSNNGWSVGGGIEYGEGGFLEFGASSNNPNGWSLGGTCGGTDGFGVYGSGGAVVPDAGGDTAPFVGGGVTVGEGVPCGGPIQYNGSC